MSRSLMQPKPLKLFAIFCGVFVIFVLVGFVLSKKGHTPSPEHAVDALADGRTREGESELLLLIQTNPDNEELWYVLLASLATNPHPFPDVFKFDPSGRYLQAMNFALQIIAGKPTPVPELHPLLADIGGILMMANQDIKAIEFHQKAERLHPDSKTRQRILRSMKRLGWHSDFNRLMQDSIYFQSADDLLRAEYHLHKHDFLSMAQDILLHQFKNYRLSIVAASSAIGVCWLILLLHVGRSGSWPIRTIVGVPVAFILGVFSAYATLCAYEIEGLYYVFDGKQSWLVTLLYAVFGIGLREEFLKLIFISPLLLFFRKGAPIQVLILATIGGLGFAIEENNQYYVNGGATVIGRFLTANFLHMSTTGLLGFSLVSALNDSRQWGNFFERMAYVILVHGFYDFLLMDTTFGNLSFFATFVFILVARTHLRLTAELAGGRVYSIAPVLVFTVALAISMGISYLMFAVEIGAMRGFIQTLLSTASMMFVAMLFFQEFSRET
ncbi:MAG: PrsW family intramembrane metalloprotease [Spirochaetia bacterium]|nr:PrsW family intramembrane metalloprotease [Spirochaetia bacterium]